MEVEVEEVDLSLGALGPIRVPAYLESFSMASVYALSPARGVCSVYAQEGCMCQCGR